MSRLYSKYRYRREIRWDLVLLISILALLAAIMMFSSLSQLFNDTTYTATVTEKIVDRSNDSSTFLIFTVLEDGEIRVFSNNDAWLRGKFNSSDVQAKLTVGKTYELRVVGWRIPIFSSYQNIISAIEK